MLHGFTQYHDPRVLTVLVDGEFWGGEGGVRKCADGHCDHAGPAFDDVCDRRAAIRAELVSRLVPAVSHTLPRFQSASEHNSRLWPSRLRCKGAAAPPLAVQAVAD